MVKNYSTLPLTSGNVQPTHAHDNLGRPSRPRKGRSRVVGNGVFAEDCFRRIAPPPIGALMNFRIGEVTEGRAVFLVEPAEYHYNPIGVVHGGLAATLLDSAMGCAVHSTLPVGASYTTLEIKVNYIRPMSAETGVVRCEAKTIHVGGRTATAEGRIVDQKGKLYAHGTTTCIIFRPAS